MQVLNIFHVLVAIALIAFVLVQRGQGATAGAAFGSQNSYAITAAGITWSVFLLGEALSLWSGLALVMIVAGLALVGAKREAAPPTSVPAPTR